MVFLVAPVAGGHFLGLLQVGRGFGAQALDDFGVARPDVLNVLLGDLYQSVAAHAVVEGLWGVAIKFKNILYFFAN